MAMSAKENNSRFSLKAYDLSSHMFLASFMSLYILIQWNNTYILKGLFKQLNTICCWFYFWLICEEAGLQRSVYYRKINSVFSSHTSCGNDTDTRTGHTIVFSTFPYLINRLIFHITIEWWLDMLMKTYSHISLGYNTPLWCVSRSTNCHLLFFSGFTTSANDQNRFEKRCRQIFCYHRLSYEILILER